MANPMPWDTEPPASEGGMPWDTAPPGSESEAKPSYNVDLKSTKAKASNQAEMVKRTLYTPGSDFFDLPEAQKQQMLKQAEFVAKEPNTKLRHSLKDDVLEVPRFLSEATAATANAFGRGLGSAAGVVNGLGRAVMTGSVDEGLDQYKRTIDALKFNDIQSPMAPSKTGEGFSSLAGMGTEAYGNLIGDQETAQKHSQAGMDILALLGAKGGAKYAKPAMELAKDTTLRGVDKIPYMSDTALYSQALKPGSSLSKKGQVARARAVETGLNKEAVVSPSGNAIGAKGINDVINETFGEEGGLYQQGEKIVMSSEFKNARVGLDSILEGAKKTTSDLAAGNKEAARSAVDKVVNELKEHPSYDPRTNSISAEGAYREKQKLYKNLQKAYEQDALTGIKDAQTEVASQLRQVTGEVIPELKDILAKEGENLNFIKYATRRMEKLSSEGALHNSLGMIINTPKAIALRVFQSPGFKSRLAIAIRKAKNRAAKPAEIQAVIDQVSAPFVEDPKQFNPEVAPPPEPSGLGDYIPGREQTVAPRDVQFSGNRVGAVDRAVQPDVQPPGPKFVDRAVQPDVQPPGPKFVDRANSGGEPSLRPDPMGGLDLKVEVKKAGGGKKGVADVAKQMGVPAAVLATWLLADENKKKQLAMLPAFAGLVRLGKSRASERLAGGVEPVKNFGKYDLEVSLKDASGKLLTRKSGSPYGVKSHLDTDTGRFVIEEIEVPKELQGQKVGSYLRQQVIEQAKKRGAKGISSSQYGDTLDSRHMWETPEGKLRPGVQKSPYAVVDEAGGITTNDHGPSYWMDF